MAVSVLGVLGAHTWLWSLPITQFELLVSSLPLGIGEHAAFFCTSCGNEPVMSASVPCRLRLLNLHAELGGRSRRTPRPPLDCVQTEALSSFLPLKELEADRILERQAPAVARAVRDSRAMRF